MRYTIPSKDGKAVRIPDELYTEGLHHCLAVVLYSPRYNVISLAHVFDNQGRYGTRQVVNSLLEDMSQITVNFDDINDIRAHLIGELDTSRQRKASRSDIISEDLRNKEIRTVNGHLGGEMWRDVLVSYPSIIVEEYHEMSKFKHGVYRPERIVQLIL